MFQNASSSGLKSGFAIRKLQVSLFSVCKLRHCESGNKTGQMPFHKLSVDVRKNIPTFLHKVKLQTTKVRLTDSNRLIPLKKISYQNNQSAGPIDIERPIIQVIIRNKIPKHDSKRLFW